MALLHMDFYSKTLGRGTHLNAILPERSTAPQWKTLYLLHGMGDDYTSWQRKTNVERYALARGIAVVMPDGGLSCYHNMAHGERYRDYILDELPQLMRRCFPLSPRREDSFIAGCSMGGFGALKLGLARPEQYAAIGCFSAAHMEYRPDNPRNRAMLLRVYGDTIDECDAQIERDIRAANAGSNRLRIWHACGDGDVLRPNGERTRDFFSALPDGAIDYSYQLMPGKHDWELWDRMLAEFLQTLPAGDGRVM